MSSSYGKISSGASGFDPYGKNNKYLQGTKNFLQSNSIVAKIAFLILVIFVFVVLLRIGTSILANVFSFTTTPILLNGMMNGQRLVRIPQNPGSANAIPILRSKNQRDGLVFTWSTWLFVKQPGLANHGCLNCPTSQGQYRHVFSKGSDTVGKNGMMSPNNAPGLYITPDHRNLVVVMSTFDNPREEVVIGDLPIEHWINVIIRQDQHRMDVFINGTLTRSAVLKGVPNQNYDDVYIGLNGGFAGNISQLQYFAYAIGANKIQEIVDTGPNLKSLDGDLNDTNANYLSFRWFFPTHSSEMQ